MTVKIEDTEDKIIIELSKLIKDGKDTSFLLKQYEQSQNFVLRKGAWAYFHYYRRIKEKPRYDYDQFLYKHGKAWDDFLLSAAKVICGCGQISIETLNISKKNMYLTWHFPEYPLFSKLFSSNSLVFIARDAAWMQKTLKKDNLFNFKKSKLKTILKKFQEGYPVTAMMDFCYPETNSINTTFLGYPARTPVGILKLGYQYGYNINVLGWNGTSPEILATFNSHDCSLYDQVSIINNKFEKNILRDPTVWLLWSSVDHRWVGVDYNY